jgi:hypothetical protein
MRVLSIRGIVVAALVAVAAIPASAHKFHTSLANVDYRRESETIEISLRLFADDLEASASTLHGSRVEIGTGEASERAVFDYVKSAFRLRDASGAPIALEWVGLEPQSDVVWVYVEARSSKGLDGVTMANTLFFDLFDDQVNLAILRDGERKASVVFKPGSESTAVALE